MRTRFPSTDEVVEIHRRLLARFGGEGGLRDAGLLESALYRPQCGYYLGLPEMAAALFESLLINHPFLDGNKRVGFFVTDVFLRMNGHALDVDDETAYRFLMDHLRAGTCDYSHLLPWITNALRPL